MATIRHAVILGVLLGAAPALAQGPNRGSAATPAAPAADQALAVPHGRQITATGQTKPPAPACRSPGRRAP